MTGSRKDRKKKDQDPRWWVPIVVAALTAISSIAGCVSQVAAR
jgi:hypothetical protein